MGYKIGDYVYVKIFPGRITKYGYGRIYAKLDSAIDRGEGYIMNLIVDGMNMYERSHVPKDCILHKVTDKVHIVELKLKGL